MCSLKEALVAFIIFSVGILVGRAIYHVKTIGLLVIDKKRKTQVIIPFPNQSAKMKNGSTVAVDILETEID